MQTRKKTSVPLTELEGAALSVIRALGACTPYQVRQDFLQSRSREWSGSAGAVYPALRRLQTRGLLRAEQTGDARRSVLYSLSPTGVRAFLAWLSDAERAIGSGLDPFRCRADHWFRMPAGERKEWSATLRSQLQRRLQWLTDLSAQAETTDPQALLLEIELQRARLRWLEALP